MPAELSTGLAILVQVLGATKLVIEIVKVIRCKKCSSCSKTK